MEKSTQENEKVGHLPHITVIRDFEDEHLQQENNITTIKLQSGATVFITKYGNIQLAMPPGSFSELQKLKIEIPQYYIIPSIRFHKKYAINLADFQELAFNNYILNRKTYLICSNNTEKALQNVFQLTYPTIRPHEIDPIIDFYSSIDKNPIPNFIEEQNYLKTMFKSYNDQFELEEMIEFINIDKQNDAIISENVRIRKGAEEFVIVVDNQEASASEKFELETIEKINWEKVMLDQFDVKSLVKQQIQNISKLPKNNNSKMQKYEERSAFEIQFLPRLHFEEVSLGFIIWIQGRGALVDPPLFCNQILQKLQISISQIEWVIITQVNNRNDHGAFQLIFENSNIEIITTRQIYYCFLEKYSKLSQMSYKFLESILKFRPVCLGAPLVLKNCKFKFYYGFNFVPSLCFEAVMDKKSLYYIGESLISPVIFKDMLIKKVISKDRFDQLSSMRWKNSQIVILYAGQYSWNTDLHEITELPEMTQDLKKRIFILTRDNSNEQLIKKLGFTQLIYQELQSVSLIDTQMRKMRLMDEEVQKKKDLQKKIDLLSTIEIFENISIKNFKDLLLATKEEYYEPGEYIIRQGTVGTKFYFVLSGIVCIFTDDETVKRFYPAGTYFGETALKVDPNKTKEQQRRGANAVAVKPCVLLSLERQDFWFIFGEEQDEAAPIIQKLTNIQSSRKEKTSNLIKKNSYFEQLSENQITELEMIAVEKTFENNTVIWSKDTEAEFAILVKEGALRFENCAEKYLNEMGEGYFIGEINALVSEKQSERLLTTSLVAKKKTEAFSINKQDLCNFFKKNLGILLKLIDKKYFN